MTKAKIIIIPGSTRQGSVTTQLGKAIAKSLEDNGAEANVISLADFDMPIYDGDLEQETGVPENAVKLAKLIDEHQGVVLVNPEYNSSLTPLLKNTLDWLSRDVGTKPYQNRAFALAACSPGMLGGVRVLSHARDILVSIGADTITPQIAVGGAGSAFNDDLSLKNERAASLLQSLSTTLIERAKTHL